MDEQSLKAAELLLGVGIEVPMKTRWFGIRGVTMQRPTLGAMMRIAELYGRLETSFAELKGKEIDEQMAFVAKHGKTISRIVAYAVCSGRIAGRMFNGVVAWWLRWNVHPAFLFNAMLAFVMGSRVRDFCSIIPLAKETTELLKPIGSHKGKMS